MRRRSRKKRRPRAKVRRAKARKEKRFDIRYTNFYIDQNTIIYTQPFFT
jgi:hypothetical protein